MPASSLQLRTTLGLVAFALIIRLLPLLYVPTEDFSFGDARDYQHSSYALCHGLAYPNATELPFFRAPGLPLFLTVSTVCQPYSIVLGRLALISTDLLSVLGLIILGSLVGLKATGQFVSALAFSLSPLIVGQTLDIQSEPLFQCLFIWLGVCIIRDTPALRIVAGVLFALAALTRPIALGFLPLILWFINHVSASGRLKNISIFCLGASLTLAPWGMANYGRTGDFILINDAGGYNFWRGNHPIMAEIYAAKDRDTLNKLSHRLEHEFTPALVAQTTQLSAKDRSTFFFDQGLKLFYTEPLNSMKMLLQKCWIFLRPTVHGGAWPALIWWIITLWETSLYVCASCTLLNHRLSLKGRLGIGAYLLLALLLSIPFQVVTRFRVPLYEWVLILLTAHYVEGGKWLLDRAPPRERT